MKTLPFLLLASLLAFCTINKPAELTKEELLNKCVDSDPSDYVCDSCFYSVYGYYDTIPSYSMNHYSR
jgi:hypothetical protein